MPLVRPGHVAQVVTIACGVMHRPGGVQPRGLDQQVNAALGQKPLVARRADVLHHGVRHIGVDVDVRVREPPPPAQALLAVRPGLPRQFRTIVAKLPRNLAPGRKPS